MNAHEQVRKAAAQAADLVTELQRVHAHGGGLAGETERALLRELLEREIEAARELRQRLSRVAGLLEEDV